MRPLLPSVVGAFAFLFLIRKQAARQAGYHFFTLSRLVKHFLLCTRCINNILLLYEGQLLVMDSVAYDGRSSSMRDSTVTCDVCSRAGRLSVHVDPSDNNLCPASSNFCPAMYVHIKYISALWKRHIHMLATDALGLWTWKSSIFFIFPVNLVQFLQL